MDALDLGVCHSEAKVPTVRNALGDVHRHRHRQGVSNFSQFELAHLQYSNYVYRSIYVETNFLRLSNPSLRRRSALPITDTELNDMAAAAHPPSWLTAAIDICVSYSSRPNS